MYTFIKIKYIFVMSNSASSLTTHNCPNSQNNINKLKQSVVKMFFIDVQTKTPNS